MKKLFNSFAILALGIFLTPANISSLKADNLPTTIKDVHFVLTNEVNKVIKSINDTSVTLDLVSKVALSKVEATMSEEDVEKLTNACYSYMEKNFSIITPNSNFAPVKFDIPPSEYLDTIIRKLNSDLEAYESELTKRIDEEFPLYKKDQFVSFTYTGKYGAERRCTGVVTVVDNRLQLRAAGSTRYHSINDFPKEIRTRFDPKLNVEVKANKKGDLLRHWLVKQQADLIKEIQNWEKNLVSVIKINQDCGWFWYHNNFIYYKKITLHDMLKARHVELKQIEAKRRRLAAEEAERRRLAEEAAEAAEEERRLKKLRSARNARLRRFFSQTGML